MENGRGKFAGEQKVAILLRHSGGNARACVLTQVHQNQGNVPSRDREALAGGAERSSTQPLPYGRGSDGHLIPRQSALSVGRILTC